jgi:acyl carrier protein
VNVIEEQIADVLANQLRVQRAVIAPEVSFSALNIDSLVLVELTLLLGDAFGVEIEEGELHPEMSVAAAGELIAGKSPMP